MTGRTQTLPWWLGEEGMKTTENKIHSTRVGRSLLPERKGTWTMVETSSVERDSGVSKLAGEASGPRIPASNKLK
jgi:hypothetical protein